MASSWFGGRLDHCRDQSFVSEDWCVELAELEGASCESRGVGGR